MPPYYVTNEEIDFLLHQLTETKMLLKNSGFYRTACAMDDLMRQANYEAEDIVRGNHTTQFVEGK